MTLRGIIAVTVLSSAIATLASASVAPEPNNVMGCLHLSKQVSDEMSANPQSPNQKVAREDRSAAQQFCQRGLYAQGMARYEKALNELEHGNS